MSGKLKSTRMVVLCFRGNKLLRLLRILVWYSGPQNGGIIDETNDNRTIEEQFNSDSFEIGRNGVMDHWYHPTTMDMSISTEDWE